MAFSKDAVPKWVKEVKEKYGKAETKFACVGFVAIRYIDVDAWFLTAVQVLLRRTLRLRRAIEQRHLYSWCIRPSSVPERVAFLQPEA